MPGSNEREGLGRNGSGIALSLVFYLSLSAFGFGLTAVLLDYQTGREPSWLLPGFAVLLVCAVITWPVLRATQTRKWRRRAAVRFGTGAALGYPALALLTAGTLQAFLGRRPDPFDEFSALLFVSSGILPLLGLPAAGAIGTLVLNPSPMTPSAAREEDEEGGEKTESDSDEKQ